MTQQQAEHELSDGPRVYRAGRALLVVTGIILFFVFPLYALVRALPLPDPPELPTWAKWVRLAVLAVFLLLLLLGSLERHSKQRYPGKRTVT